MSAKVAATSRPSLYENGQSFATFMLPLASYDSNEVLKPSLSFPLHVLFILMYTALAVGSFVWVFLNSPSTLNTSQIVMNTAEAVSEGFECKPLLPVTQQLDPVTFFVLGSRFEVEVKLFQADFASKSDCEATVQEYLDSCYVSSSETYNEYTRYIFPSTIGIETAVTSSLSFTYLQVCAIFRPLHSIYKSNVCAFFEDGKRPPYMCTKDLVLTRWNSYNNGLILSQFSTSILTGIITFAVLLYSLIRQEWYIFSRFIIPEQFYVFQAHASLKVPWKLSVILLFAALGASAYSSYNNVQSYKNQQFQTVEYYNEIPSDESLDYECQRIRPTTYLEQQPVSLNYTELTFVDHSRCGIQDGLLNSDCFVSMTSAPCDYWLNSFRPNFFPKRSDCIDAMSTGQYLRFFSLTENITDDRYNSEYEHEFKTFRLDLGNYNFALSSSQLCFNLRYIGTPNFYSVTTETPYTSGNVDSSLYEASSLFPLLNVLSVSGLLAKINERLCDSFSDNLYPPFQCFVKKPVYTDFEIFARVFSSAQLIFTAIHIFFSFTLGKILKKLEGSKESNSGPSMPIWMQAMMAATPKTLLTPTREVKTVLGSTYKSFLLSSVVILVSLLFLFYFLLNPIQQSHRIASNNLENVIASGRDCVYGGPPLLGRWYNLGTLENSNIRIRTLNLIGQGLKFASSEECFQSMTSEYFSKFCAINSFQKYTGAFTGITPGNEFEIEVDAAGIDDVDAFLTTWTEPTICLNEIFISEIPDKLCPYFDKGPFICKQAGVGDWNPARFVTASGFSSAAYTILLIALGLVAKLYMSLCKRSFNTPVRDEETQEVENNIPIRRITDITPEKTTSIPGAAQREPAFTSLSPKDIEKSIQVVGTEAKVAIEEVELQEPAPLAASSDLLSAAKVPRVEVPVEEQPHDTKQGLSLYSDFIPVPAAVPISAAEVNPSEENIDVDQQS